MRMEWKWCFRRKRAVLAALGAVLIIAILFNIASEMHSRHVQVSARLLKWVDFNVTAAAMRDALQYDIESHGTDNEIHWIDLLACLGARYGGDFSHYKKAHMDSLASQLKDGKSMDELTAGMSYFEYYSVAYESVLGVMVGDYSVQTGKTASGAPAFEPKYGLKAFSPIAK